MNELGALIPSRSREKTREPDFGTYHHSTSVVSKKAREVMNAMFTDGLDNASCVTPTSLFTILSSPFIRFVKTNGGRNNNW